MQQTWDKDRIHALLDARPEAVARAIVAVYELQTDEEKASSYTRLVNGVGFSRNDAEFMSSLAQQVLRGRTLSAKQIAIGRNKIKHYWRQLALIANADAQPVADRVSAIEPDAGSVEIVARPVGAGILPADCTCAEHEFYDGEDVCPACHRVGRGAALGFPRAYSAGSW